MENPSVVVEEQQQQLKQNQSVTTQQSAAQKSNKKKQKNKNRNSNDKTLIDGHSPLENIKNGSNKSSMHAAMNGNCVVVEDGSVECNGGKLDELENGADVLNGLDGGHSKSETNKSNGVAHHNGDVSQHHSNGIDEEKTAFAIHQSGGCNSNQDSHSMGNNAKKPKRKNEQLKKDEQTVKAALHCQQSNAAHDKQGNANNGRSSVLENLLANNQSTENHAQVQSLTQNRKLKSNDKLKLGNGFNNNNNHNNNNNDNSNGSSSSRNSIKSEPIDNTCAAKSLRNESMEDANGEEAASAPSAIVSITQSLASATISDSDTATASEASPTSSSVSSSPSSVAQTINQSPQLCEAATSSTAKKDSTANAAAGASSSQASSDQQLVNVSTELKLDLSNVHIDYKEYESELQMHDIMRLIQAELSEPYSIYTYRYFIYNWPKLCFLASHGDEYVGAIVCKLDMHMNVRRGYIAMLAVRKEYRKLRIGTTLVQKAIEAMLADKADEVVLETEMRNEPALRLYENLGFVRDKRLFRYYLNGVDALRLKLWFR